MKRTTRRRLIGWPIAIVVAYLVCTLLARHLAAEDPIGEAILGRAGSVLPLAGLVLMLRLGLIVVFPALIARAVVGSVLDERA